MVTRYESLPYRRQPSTDYDRDIAEALLFDGRLPHCRPKAAVAATSS